MSSIYDSLVSQYGSGKVQVSDGTYIVNLGSSQIIVPQNLSNEAYVVSYTPGIGDSSSNRNLIRQYFTRNQMDNAILVVASTSDTNGNYTELGYNVASSLGCRTVGAITSGFSYTGASCINEAARFSSNHSDIPTLCLAIDGTSNKHHLYYPRSTGDDYSDVNPTGAGDNLSIVIVDGQFAHLNQTAKYASNGINSYNLSFTTENYTDNNQNCHDGASIDAMQFIVPFILGKTSSITSKKNYYLMDANGNRVDMSLLKSGLNINGNSSANLNTTVPDVSEEIVTVGKDNFNIKISSYNLFNKNSNLANLGELKLVGMKDGSTSYVSSNLQYVCDSMNSIRSTIKSSDSHSTISQISTRSSVGVPGCIAGYINAYMNLVSELYEKLSLETEAIVSYAQYIVDMDNGISHAAEESLDTGVNLASTPSTADLGNNTNPNTGALTTTLAGAAGAELVNTETNSFYQPTGGYNNTGNYVPSNNVPSNDAPSNNDNNSLENTNKVEGETNTLSYQYSDGHKMIVEACGNKIVNLRYEYYLNSVDEFDQVVKKIYASFKDPSIIKSITLKNNVVNVILNESYYKDLSVSDIDSIFKGGM